MSPARRRTRLALTLVGLLIATIGAFIYLPASVDSGVADQAAINASAGDWDDVLGYQGDHEADDARFQAAADKRIAEEDKTFGMVLILIGAVIVGSRWAVRPANTA